MEQTLTSRKIQRHRFQDREYFRNPKLLLITSNDTLFFGGEGVFCNELARSFISKGWEVTILRRDARRIVRAFLTSPGNEEGYRRGSLGRIILSLTLFLPAAVLMGIRLSRIRGFDLIHAQDVIHGGLSAVILSKIFGLPLIVTAHGTQLRSGMSTFTGRIRPFALGLITALTQYVVHRSSYIMAVNSQVKKDVIWLAGESTPVLEIPTFSRAPKTSYDSKKTKQDFGLPLNAFVVGYIGRLSPEKNALLLLPALQKLLQKSADTFVLIVGDGVLRDQLADRIVDLSLGRHVKLLHFNTNIDKVLSAMNVLVVPSWTEGVPQVILESWERRIPVLASSNIEIVRGRPGSLTFSPNDPDELCEKILILMHNREIVTRLCDEGKKELDKFSNREKILRDIELTYLRAIERTFVPSKL
jgi:glycosyltransferase involved in cell wall biosynthesis